MFMNKLNYLGLAAAIALAGCATGSTPAQAPSKRGPYVGVDAALAGRAAAFEAYTRRAGAIDAAFQDPAEISRGLQTAAGYEPRQLEAGMVAYAALAALQEPAFVAGVRARGRDQARRIAADPGAALDLPGGSAAAARANAALARRGETLAAAGARVKKAAYSVQRQTWSKARIPNAPQRLAAVKRAAAYRAEPADRAALDAALSENGRRGGANPVVARGLAVAALTVLGQETQAKNLMSEPRSGQCLRLAKLNFHQCLAAAGTHYEDIYCLGVHAMSDPGQCVVEATKPVRSMRRAGL
ncbi:MAG: hypothetical protein ACOY5Y_07650 [Pseudomonadota bacterium]